MTAKKNVYTTPSHATSMHKTSRFKLLKPKAKSLHAYAGTEGLRSFSRCATRL